MQGSNIIYRSFNQYMSLFSCRKFPKRCLVILSNIIRHTERRIDCDLERTAEVSTGKQIYSALRFNAIHLVYYLECIMFLFLSLPIHFRKDCTECTNGQNSRLMPRVPQIDIVCTVTLTRINQLLKMNEGMNVTLHLHWVS